MHSSLFDAIHTHRKDTVCHLNGIDFGIAAARAKRDVHFDLKINFLSMCQSFAFHLIKIMLKGCVHNVSNRRQNEQIGIRQDDDGSLLCSVFFFF